MPSVNDPLHARVLEEAQRMLSEYGWLLADAGYEHVYTGQFKDALARCDAISSHVIRTRADRIALHEQTGRVVWYDAKTTRWKKGQDFCIEALPFLKACCDAETFGITYLFCCQRHDGTEYGLMAGKTAAQLIQRLIIPDWRRGNDTQRWIDVFKPMLSYLDQHNTDIIPKGNCTRGGGDAFVAVYLDAANLPSWRDAIRTLAE